MPGRVAVLGLVATLALAGAGWLLLQGDEPHEAAAPGAPAPESPALLTPILFGPPAPEALPDEAPAPAESLPLAGSDGLSAAERVDELFGLLAALQDRRSFEERDRLVVAALERFVLDAEAAGQREAAASVLRARLDGGALDGADLAPVSEPDGAVREAPQRRRVDDDESWLAARGLVALAGLGEPADALARCAGLPRWERPNVIVSLAWDPLREGPGLDLPIARADRLVRGPPLLPLPLGRVLSDELAVELGALLHGAPDDDPAWARRSDGAPLGMERAWLADAAQLALGAGVDASAACREPLLALIAQRPDEAGPALLALLLAQGEPARAALVALRHPHARLAADAPGGCDRVEALLLDLARIERDVRGAALRPPAALSAALGDPAGTADERLAATGEMLAWLVGDGCSAADRAVLSDALVAALQAEPDADLEWTELLALTQLNTQEALLPRLSIGYGSEPDAESAAAAEERRARRSEALLARLADNWPPHRRLAALSLVSAPPAGGRRLEEPARAALQDALAREQDPEVARWLKLALRLG
jgi:hypothetical protein